MGSPHRYIPNTEHDVAKMLGAIGHSSIDELFADIPASARLTRPLALPRAMTEPELMAELSRLSSQCANAKFRAPRGRQYTIAPPRYHPGQEFTRPTHRTSPR